MGNFGNIVQFSRFYVVWWLLVSQVSLLSWPCTEECGDDYYIAAPLTTNRILIRCVMLEGSVVVSEL